nr:MAG TPA: hypothetical protein [Caudoviricetes sp.]
MRDLSRKRSIIYIIIYSKVLNHLGKRNIALVILPLLPLKPYNFVS